LWVVNQRKGQATTLLDPRNIAESVIYFETGDSIEKILTKLFHIHSSLPPQPKPVYNSQLCANKLGAVRQGREGVQGGGL